MKWLEHLLRRGKRHLVVSVRGVCLANRGSLKWKPSNKYVYVWIIVPHQIPGVRVPSVFGYGAICCPHSNSLDGRTSYCHGDTNPSLACWRQFHAPTRPHKFLYSVDRALDSLQRWLKLVQRARELHNLGSCSSLVASPLGTDVGVAARLFALLCLSR